MLEQLEGAPGGDLIARGLDDLAQGKESTEALLVAIGAPRLRRLGLAVPPPEQMPSEPELRLYNLLCGIEPRDAHARYNALIRRLTSFEDALDLETWRVRRGTRRRPG